MVGLGRMGANLVRRLMRDGHECVVYDVDRDAIDGLADEGAVPAYSLDEMCEKLDAPRSVWVMVPAAFAGDVVSEVARHMRSGDTVIDGGNTFYQLDIERAKALAPDGIHYLDIGTSGGVFGLDRGFCLMVGGDREPVLRLAPVFDTIAAGVDSVERTLGYEGEPAPAEKGWLHCGPVGAGHFVKMVHNGIEYGIMAAYAEGLGILAAADAGTKERTKDAETAPLVNPHYYEYDIDVRAVSELWRRGSVVGSWLLDLTATALKEDPTLAHFEGHVSDSGEGRWTVRTAVDLGVPAHVITAALYERFSSRDNSEYADKVLSAMREQFGGHHEKAVST